jgi:hypothetical protein
VTSSDEARVYTHQASTVTRLMESPTGTRVWNSSERRCRRANRSCARSYTIPWPTRIQPKVSTTSMVLFTANRSSPANTAHNSSPAVASAPGSAEITAATAPSASWPDRTWSTTTFIGQGCSSTTPAPSSVMHAIRARPFQYGSA